MKGLPIFAILGLLGVTVSCLPRSNKSPAAAVITNAPRVFQVTGIIQEIKADGKTAVIRHEAPRSRREAAERL